MALFFALLIPILGAVEIEEEINMVSPECLEYRGISGRSASGVQLRFTNRCPTKVLAKVCVEESPGKYQLFETKRTIPQNGDYRVNSWSGMNPLGVWWESGIVDPSVPGPCSKG